MHTVFGKFFRYVLRLILIVILSLLFVGLAKNNRDVQGYIQLLNQKSRAESRQEGGISGIFRGGNSANNGTETINSGDIELLSGDSESTSGMDVYDPNFEQDLNQMPEDVLSSGDYENTQTDFGFVTDKSGDVVSTGDSKSQQLLDIIKNEK